MNFQEKVRLRPQLAEATIFELSTGRRPGYGNRSLDGFVPDLEFKAST